jgi:DNA-binding GntR family transcriptional regulator
MERESNFALIRQVGLTEMVKEQILSALIKGELRPGQRLIESDIAKRMGVSRGPVREAARALEQRGLLTFRPRHGFFVRVFGKQEVEDLYELRVWIETGAAAGAIRLAKDEDFDVLAAKLETMDSLARRNRMESLFDEVVGFHSSICSLSGNARLAKVCNDVLTETRQLFSLAGIGYDNPQVIAERHVPILDALRRREEPTVAREIRSYLDFELAQVRRTGVGDM